MHAHLIRHQGRPLASLPRLQMLMRGSYMLTYVCMHAHLNRHQGKEEGLREALGLYETLQRIAESVHGLRNSHAAMAHRAIADVHLLLKEPGEPPRIAYTF